MLRKDRLVMYALLWIGLSAAAYWILPKIQSRPRARTTTVATEPDDRSNRVVLAPVATETKPEPPLTETLAPKPAVPTQPAKEPEAKKQPEPRVPEPKKEPEAKKQPVPKIEPVPIKQPPRETLSGNDRHLERPDGAYTVEPLVVRQRIKITGKVRTLTVNRIDGDSALDASALVAEEVIVLDRIDTRSRLRLLVAPNGKVDLRGKLDGDSELVIEAPNGTVEVHGKVDTRSRLTIHSANGRVCFPETTVAGKEGSKIDGDSQVSVTAKAVEFHGKIGMRSRVDISAPGGTVLFADGATIDGDARLTITALNVEFRALVHGANTRAFVTLTKGGAMKFKEVGIGAYIGYKKLEPSDPEPTIDAGRVRER